jgi:acetyltransferase-like isoleucine patch superfamily enzyme
MAALSLKPLSRTWRVRHWIGKVEETNMPQSFYEHLKNRARRLLRGKSAGLYQAIRGRGNVLKADGATLSGVELDIVGDNNQVLVGRGSALSNVHIRIRGGGHRIEFGENCRISRGAVLWFEDHNGLLQVGSGTTMVEVHIAVTEDGSKVTIGEDCMFANDVDIRTGDSHSVIDAQTGERLNYAGDVVIGRNVWIAPHTVVLKGVSIGENSIIATGAVVTRSCEPGVIMGGNPAKIIKTGVSWKRERVPRQ